MSKPFVLHGYIEQISEKDYFAIFLTVNVCSRGRSFEDVERNLYEALNLYLADVKNEEDISRWVPRRAPLYYYRRYISIWLRTQIRIALPDYDAQLMARIVHA